MPTQSTCYDKDNGEHASDDCDTKKIIYNNLTKRFWNVPHPEKNPEM